MAHQDRLDIPRTIRELYPKARVRRRLRVIEPGQVVEDDRLLRRLRLAIRGGLMFAFALPIAVITERLSAGELADGAVKSGLAALFRVEPSMVLWNRWARARGGIAAPELPNDPLLDDALVERSVGSVPSYRVLVGRRRVPMHVVAVAVRNDRATHHGAYVATVRLPDEVVARFPASSLVRRRGLGLAGEGARRGGQLELESIRLHDDAHLLVDGGDALDWRALMDPALVDLLAEGIHVEWIQRGSRLTLHSPAPAASIGRPEGERLDALAVAAVAIERRFATIAGNGRALDPAQPGWAIEQGRERVRRHLRTSRERDLAMSIEDQFIELARYTSQEEVDRVRAAIDAGTFRVDHLDDLIHHRRAAVWGADREDAA